MSFDNIWNIIVKKSGLKKQNFSLGPFYGY